MDNEEEIVCGSLNTSASAFRGVSHQLLAENSRISSSTTSFSYSTTNSQLPPHYNQQHQHSILVSNGATVHPSALNASSISSPAPHSPTLTPNLTPVPSCSSSPSLNSQRPQSLHCQSANNTPHSNMQVTEKSHQNAVVGSPVNSAAASTNGTGSGGGGGSTPQQTMVRPKLASRVVLNVGGEKITVDPGLFQNYPNTMLGRMFGPSLDHNLTKKNSKGEYEIGGYVTEETFKLILEFYRMGYMRIPPHIQVSEVKIACDYFLVPFNDETVRAANMAALLHELANEGAHTQFSQFLDNIIRPVIVQLTRKGERECHVVVLMSEDVVDWDVEYPPPKYPDQPEVEASLTRDDHLCRFLKYVENRDVAKNVLKDRGLKKIKLGIEGFPTQKEKMKTTIRGRPEVVYNYIQRPFIHFSWEKEEARSRHVDFQCPPVNLSTNLAEAASDTDIDQPQGSSLAMAEQELQMAAASAMAVGAGPGGPDLTGGSSSSVFRVTEMLVATGGGGGVGNSVVSLGTSGGGAATSLRLAPHLTVSSAVATATHVDYVGHMQAHSPPINDPDYDPESSQVLEE